jgi:CBS domain-containing protein
MIVHSCHNICRSGNTEWGTGKDKKEYVPQQSVLPARITDATPLPYPCELQLTLNSGMPHRETLRPQALFIEQNCPGVKDFPWRCLLEEAKSSTLSKPLPTFSRGGCVMTRSFKTIHVHEVMTTTLVTVSPEDSLQHALTLLEKHQVHELPVAERDHLIGIVTAGDIKLMTPAYPLFPDQEEIRQTLRDLKVAAAMTLDPFVISPNATLLEATRQLYDRSIRALLVAEEGRLLGIISVSDVLRIVLEQQEA